MRVALTTIGSTGDIQPFLALAFRLMKNGHSVRLCTHSMYKDKVESLGVPFYSAAPNISEEFVNEQMQTLLKTFNPVRAVGIVIEQLLLRDSIQRFNDCLEGVRGFDVVVCHHADFAGQEAALRLGIPWVSTILSPEPIKTTKNMPLPFARVSLGDTLNRFLWWLGHSAVRRALRPSLETLQSAIKSSRGANLDFVPLSKHLNLLAASRHIAVVEADFPSNIVLTGNWYADEDAGFVPGSDLRSFLDAGPPPVVVSFGSMGAGDGQEVGGIVAEAIRRSDQRAIVQKGWGGLDIASSDQFLAVGYVPHSFLFSKASCVIHHGGAGTTAAACRAGLPSVVVPHVFDQFYWARCLTGRGVAPRMLHKWFLTPQRLARRISEVLSNPSYALHSRELGERVRNEDGLGVAVAAIEGLATKIKVA